MLGSSFPALAAAHTSQKIRRRPAIVPAGVVLSLDALGEAPAVGRGVVEQPLRDGDHHLRVLGVAPARMTEQVSNLAVLARDARRAPPLHGPAERIADRRADKGTAKSVA